ncbi:hypothetical protein C5167_024887 [Papaver somniferum]|uniref:MORF/ORRM1/DAG-like MORF domain-containing protein n=1 Tax=Papaver somniferum TaxID=3469 RepID=A0A4Y7JTP1_PAPSO|nr:multiple organellar RNA editing factor 8, chloroplastic/mitochondrial-like isoform X2 [Papaver somniferum]RZC63139.1 hypothetical protein C5167_024887 [Papaver somniferum]
MAMTLCRRGGALIKSIPSSASVCRSFSSCSSNLSRGLRPVIALTEFTNRFPSTKTILPAAATLKSMFTTTTTSSVSDPKPNNNHPPKENTVPEDFDFDCWIMLIRLPEGDPKIIVGFFNTLTDIMKSEEESRIKIYSCYDGYYFGFGAFSEELANKIEELPGVRWVEPASYFDDIKNGELAEARSIKQASYMDDDANEAGRPSINRKAVQPGSCEEWMRNELKKDMQRERDMQSRE